MQELKKETIKAEQKAMLSAFEKRKVEKGIESKETKMERFKDRKQAMLRSGMKSTNVSFSWKSDKLHFSKVSLVDRFVFGDNGFCIP